MATLCQRHDHNDLSLRYPKNPMSWRGYAHCYCWGHWSLARSSTFINIWKVTTNVAEVRPEPIIVWQWFCVLRLLALLWYLLYRLSKLGSLAVTTYSAPSEVHIDSGCEVLRLWAVLQWKVFDLCQRYTWKHLGPCSCACIHRIIPLSANSYGESIMYQMLWI